MDFHLGNKHDPDHGSSTSALRAACRPPSFQPEVSLPQNAGLRAASSHAMTTARFLSAILRITFAAAGLTATVRGDTVLAPAAGDVFAGFRATDGQGAS